jgi:Glycosyl hydrolase family 12
MWNLQPYFVAQDMWNASGYSVTQTIYACSYSNWYVTATMNNDNGDGAVKTYPNSHRDFDNSPQINSFHSITSTFAESGPDTGIYEDAYDIWLNGIASSGSTEVMIWNDNHGQTPGGSVQGSATIDGRTYSVWRAGTYIAFEADTNFTSGTMNLMAFFQWIMSKGWIPSNSTLGQIDYGAELVSTNNVPLTYSFSNFSVSTS